MSEAIYNWENEKYDYDYDTNTCKQGRACGHYTQVKYRMIYNKRFIHSRNR